MADIQLPAVFTQGAVARDGPAPPCMARVEFSEGSALPRHDEEEASVTLISSLPPPISLYSVISIFIRIASLKLNYMYIDQLNKMCDNESIQVGYKLTIVAVWLMKLKSQNQRLG